MRGGNVSDDPDLRSQLERIASAVGDPPEHGLERVAARRHRRLRRRRGAVATAAVLAVLATGTALIDRAGDRPESVTASESATPAGAPAEVPDRVEVRCEPTGIVIPVASVRPQRDGLHIRVINDLGTPTTVQVENPGQWNSGEIAVGVGISNRTQPVPPGELRIGCYINGKLQRRSVNLVDPTGIYRTPELGCDDAVRMGPLPVDPSKANLIEAARLALEPRLTEPDEHAGRDAVGAVRGYPAQRLVMETDDPVVQFTREGRVIAFAHVRGADGAPDPPWTTVERAEVCPSYIREATTTTQAPATTRTTAAAPAG
jgi:hypothetical protein